MKTKGPSIFTTVGKSYLRSALKPTPLWTHLFVTRHCNFNCQYCGAVDNQRKDPTFEEICRWILKLKSLGCHCIGFMGGEPTLRKDFVDIVEFCSQNQVYTQLSTNGTLLLKNIGRQNGQNLLKNLTQAGLGVINLSVDSVVENFKASNKKLPRANRILEALQEEKRENGLNFILNCVISKQNFKQVPQLLEFCHSQKIVMAAIFVQNPFQFINPGISRNNQVFFSKKDADIVSQTADYLIDKKKKGYRLVEPLEYYEAVKKWVRGGYFWKCDAGKYSLVVDTDGGIAICGYLPYLPLNIDDLGENYFEKVEPWREKYLDDCPKKCLPSCNFCTSFYRQNPVKFLYYKFRY